MLQTDLPSKEWAALRVWAAEIRDRLHDSLLIKVSIITLISVLDSCEALRKIAPLISKELWSSALLLGNELIKDVPPCKKDGDWKINPPEIRKTIV